MKESMTTSSKTSKRVPTSEGSPEEQRERANRHHSEAGTPSSEQESAARQQREERILDAAAALLMRWGYRKTTIDDVAREAGVGKGTIYLHWKDKHALFRAAIWRAHQQVSEDVMQRVATDPAGGFPHRLWTHGMLAALANPLMAAIMKGNPDIFQGLVGAFDQETRDQLVGNADAYVAQMQQARLIRADLPVSVITYLMSALKVGIINSSDFIGQDNMPSMEQLTEALSDLMRRWLEPEQAPGTSDAGKQFLAEWLENVQYIEKQLQ
jgi:AcrR family transcriptional regulator